MLTLGPFFYIVTFIQIMSTITKMVSTTEHVFQYYFFLVSRV